jgi:ubiquinone/menaquinone biosynthesis C-methylase UbiE
VTGDKVLDLGCGYGTFAQSVLDAGKEGVGLDLDFRKIETGMSVYPALRARLVQGDIHCLPFKDRSFPTVVLRESLHHLAWETNLPEILRVCSREILVFEPNPNPVLRFCRRMISHQDQEVPLGGVLVLLKRHQVSVQEVSFRDLFAFPLSGGMVGWELIPPVRFLFPLWLWMDRILQKLFRLIHVERMLSWRYLVRGVFDPQRQP